MSPAAARRWHAVTAAVALGALVLQLGLIVFGTPALLEERDTALGIRLLRFVEYFTVQSNLLVVIVSWQLARRPDRDGRWWVVARSAAVLGIVVTGITHFILLRPLLHLHGGNWVADKLLHQVVPVLVLVGWLVAGPRPRLPWRAVGWSLLWPIGWLGMALVVGATTGWYPYPFLDPDHDGTGAVVVSCVAITALFVVVGAVLHLLDGRMDPAPRPRRGSADRR